jgi:hypothetical protein
VGGWGFFKLGDGCGNSTYFFFLDLGAVLPALNDLDRFLACRRRKKFWDIEKTLNLVVSFPELS